MNSSQILYVKRYLVNHGEISRNDALKNYITRLGAIIFILKNQGWRFETKKVETRRPDGKMGYDFVYKLISRP